MTPSSRSIYLSYSQADEPWAAEFRQLLEPLGYAIASCRTSEIGSDARAAAESALTQCDVVVVLLGAETRESRWVDMEIALGMEPRCGRPSAGLLGIILRSHADFSKPYYDPENFPPRLHDRVRWEYAVVKKWLDDPLLISQWLLEADRRRYHFRSSTNVKVLRALRAFAWNDSVDTPRPVLKMLLEQEE